LEKLQRDAFPASDEEFEEEDEIEEEDEVEEEES
jgi:hypothetical protein